MVSWSQYSPLIGPDDEYCGKVSWDWSADLILSSDWRSDHSKCRASSGERRLVYAQKTDVRMMALDTNMVTPVVAKTRSRKVIVKIDNYNIGWRRHLLILICIFI